jgi:hypothetical protein
MTEEIAENERNASLRRIRDLEARYGALMVDANRREEAAAKRAEDCAQHGSEIQYLRHLASWCWNDGQDADEARQAVIVAMQQLAKQLDGITEPVPVDKLRDWLKRAMAAHTRKVNKPPSYPTLADCQRAGGCDHEDIDHRLKAKLEEAAK